MVIDGSAAKKYVFSMLIGTYGVPPWSTLWFPCARTRWAIYIVQYFENWLIFVLYLTILSSYVIEFWSTIANFGVDLYSCTVLHRATPVKNDDFLYFYHFHHAVARHSATVRFGRLSCIVVVVHRRQYALSLDVALFAPYGNVACCTPRVFVCFLLNIFVRSFNSRNIRYRDCRIRDTLVICEFRCDSCECSECVPFWNHVNHE